MPSTRTIILTALALLLVLAAFVLLRGRCDYGAPEGFRLGGVLLVGCEATP